MEHTWKKSQLTGLIILILLFFNDSCLGDAITKIPGDETAIALTFDACETEAPSYFDKAILKYLVDEKIPFTIFMSGRFAKRNSAELAELSKSSLIEIENHSLNHPQHMEKLDREEATREVVENEKIIEEITGRKPVFFRFPAGNYDGATLKLVESLGYKVVHWTFPSGDPDKKITADKLSKWVVSRVKGGNILIFHINGRGYHTAEALPSIVQHLKKKGYKLVRLDECRFGNQ